MDSKKVYVRMRRRIEVSLGHTVTVGDIATITGNGKFDEIVDSPISTTGTIDGNYLIIDMMSVIKKISSLIPDVVILPIGPTETIVTIRKSKSKLTGIYFVMIWLLLFIGAGLAIMNFHEDVSMKAVHHRLYQLITGEASAKPLLLQIPYSIGLGLGMILFFNHFFKKRLTDEPSPLEIEMFQYEQVIDQYTVEHDEGKMKNNSDVD